MKTNKFLVVLAASLLGLTFSGLTACGKWTKDPLAGKDARFRNGLPVPTKPDFSKPLPSDAIRIVAPDFTSLEEGVAAEFEITGRVLLEGYDVELQFENLNDFPGARYNPATNRLTWTPPKGYVDSKNKGNVWVELPLIMKAIGTKPNAQVLVGTRTIGMRVSREFAAPEVTRVEKSDLFIREGTTSLIQVYVRDRDANASDVSSYPRVILQSVAGTKSLAGVLSASRTDSLGNGEYRIYMQVDLRDVELTGGVDNFKVGLIAASRYGKLSPIRIMDFDIYTSFAMPASTWIEEFVVTAETPAVQKFIIADPKQEGILSLDRTFNLPVGSTFTCVNTNPSTLNCTFSWTPVAGSAGTVVDLQAYVLSRNRDARDTSRPIKTLNFRTRVLPKGP